MSSDERVGIVGLGIHPFGHHPERSGLEMAARAARAALADAGVVREDVDFAAGGSDAAGNADTTVSVLGLTGVPFINVKNGCAIGGSALTIAHAMLTSGAAELALVVGFDKHRPARSTRCPRSGGSALVRRDGADPDDAVLGAEDPALHAEHGSAARRSARLAVRGRRAGGCGRCTRSRSSCAARPAPARSPGAAGWASHRSTAHPA